MTVSSTLFLDASSSMNVETFPVTHAIMVDKITVVNGKLKSMVQLKRYYNVKSRLLQLHRKTTLPSAL